MNKEKLPQSLRTRLVVLFREVLAMNSACEFDQELSFNRLSGAVYNELLDEKNSGLNEDAAVDAAVHLTRKENLNALLSSYDSMLKRKAKQANRQVHGIVENLISQDTPDREQVVVDTLAMLEQFQLVRSIPGIRKLVQARIDNGHQDVDSLEYMYES